MPSVSKPGPRLAEDAGTRTITAQPARWPPADRAPRRQPDRHRAPPPPAPGPPRAPPTAPPTTRAAAALRATMSRCGPGSPARTFRASAALVTGSPPLSSAGGLRAARGWPDRGSMPRRCRREARPPGEGPVVDSSSRPSSPWTSRTCSAPWELSTASIRSAIVRSATPTTMRRTRPGLASGPRTLNAVAHPSRASAARRGEGRGGNGGPGRNRCRPPRRSGRRRPARARWPRRAPPAGRPRHSATTRPDCRACRPGHRRRRRPAQPTSTR